MVTMTPLSVTHGFTRADLDAMPDDGRRHELIDGVIVVTPSPIPRHQDVVGELFALLRTSRTPDLKVYVAPLDVALDPHVIVPDIVVARRADLSAKDLPTAPLLAVEVLSPSTRWIDLGRKKELLAGAGCPSYWVIDPGQGATPPTLIVFELEGQEYAEVARITGSEAWTATRPFPVTVVPNLLLDE